MSQEKQNIEIEPEHSIPISDKAGIQAQLRRINTRPTKKEGELPDTIKADFFNLTRSMKIDDKTAEHQINLAVDQMRDIDDAELQMILQEDILSEDFRRILKEQFQASDDFIEVVEKNKSAFCEILRSIYAIGFSEQKEAIKYSELTFAMPSTTTMMTIIPLFTGRYPNIPAKLLSKPDGKNYNQELEEVAKYMDALVETKTEGYSASGEENVSVFINLPENSIVDAKAVATNQNLFADLKSYHNDNIAYKMRQVFGIEGLRHFLGLIVCMEEQGRTGTFIWNVNEHLQKLGYRRKTNGAFNPDLKRMASQLVITLDQLMIIADKKHGANSSIKGQKLFSIVGFDIEHNNSEIINESITIRAEDFWYNSAFQLTEKASPKYTKLLKSIVKESHRSHPITIIWAPLLAIFWRMNIERKFSVESIFKWCNLESTGKKKSTNIHKLEKELDYMIEKNYLGGWLCDDDENLKPSQTADPMNCILTFYPPEWMTFELKQIEDKKETYHKKLTSVEKKAMNNEKFMDCFTKADMNITTFCKAVGIGRRTFYNYKDGTRNVPDDVIDKLKNAFPTQFG